MRRVNLTIANPRSPVKDGKNPHGTGENKASCGDPGAVAEIPRCTRRGD
jgi:hypothetical protein